MTNTISLYYIGLFETMCFQGVNYINYWYMTSDHLYHQDRGSKILNRKALDGKIGLRSTRWEYDIDD